MKERGEKISMLTADYYSMAVKIDEAKMDAIKIEGGEEIIEDIKKIINA